MNLQLRPYQSEIISMVHRSFMQGNKRPLVCLPCGAGKTVIFAWMARQTQLKNKNVWFLVHRRELMDQTHEAFKKFDIPEENISIGMVMTVANRPDKWPKPDLIIFDEAQHCMAATWRKIIGNFPQAWLIGLTATPCRLDGKPLGAIYDDLIIGPDTQKLIGQGFLAPYRYYAPSVADLSGLGKKGGDFDQGQASQMLMKKTIYGDVIKHWREHANGYQTIVYCSTIQHSKEIAAEFQESGINAVHFDGETPTKERQQIVEKFRNREIQILCNVDLIGEGFDVPDCWCCIMLRPTMSTGLFIQQAGRALRPQEGKTAIVLDHVGNYDRHGLPADEREWSLTEKLKQPREQNTDGTLRVRQCEYCYYTFATGPTVCPNCGADIRLRKIEIDTMKEIELQEIQGYLKREKKREEWEAKSYADLQRIEKERGYKKGWAYFKAKARKYI